MKKTELPILKTELPEIFAGDAVVLALLLDKENQKERILVGTELNIRLYLEGKQDVAVLFDKERPLGTLILDHDAQERGWWGAEVLSPLRNALTYPKERNVHECTAWHHLKDMLSSDNAVSVFVAGRAMSYYCPEKNNRTNEKKADMLEKKMLLLTRSFRKPILNDECLEWEKIMENVRELLRFTVFRHETDLRVCYPWHDCNQEFVLVEDSLLSLFLYYLRRLQDWGLCFRICEVCGKYFVAESGHYCLCSTACEKEQNRRNKQAYDERNKDNREEQTYQSKRDRIRKLLNKFSKKENVTAEMMEFAEAQYDTFRGEAKSRKRRLKTKKEKDAFVDWLYDQEREFEEMYGGKR